MERSIARARAMQLIYEHDMGGEGGDETRLNLLCIDPVESEIEFMNGLVQGVLENQAAIDEKISAFLRGWTIERISRVDLAILRLGTYELLLKETPSAVVVNEAVELAKTYSTEKSGAFVNGVLGNISREEA